MIRVGITGQGGFVGWHLYHTLKLRDDVELVDFERDFFERESKLIEFVDQCDVVVHLAALNRHPDPEQIYLKNMDLVYKLIGALEASGSQTHVIFSSSTQEDRDNPYARSKKEARILFEAWANKNDMTFSGMVIPNVFGAFGKPNYNSVVATFCHKLNTSEEPEIHVDAELSLIYIAQLVAEFEKEIRKNLSKTDNKVRRINVPEQYHCKVSDLLKILTGFMTSYIDGNEFPDLKDPFVRDLFLTFRTFVPTEHYPKLFTQHKDPRGAFVEIARTASSGQFSFSTTVPGITRGEHYHTRKAERFAVIKGKAKIELRKTGSDEIVTYLLDGENPAFVDMPIWTTHNITNIGQEELLTLFWINEPFNPDDADTYFEKVRKDQPN